MKKNVFEVTVSCAVLSDQSQQPGVFEDPQYFIDAGFTFEAMEKMRNSSAYNSELYFEALKFIH